MNRKIVAFELNEVPYQVIDAFIKRHPESNFAKVLPRSASLTAVNPDRIQLHPKISWQTFHRGVPDTDHQFLEYNQVESAGKDQYPPIWEILRTQGLSVGVGASIGAYPKPEDTHNIEFYLTDPFAPDPASKPNYISVFQRFNTAAVAHSSRNVRAGGAALNDIIQLLANVPRLGIRPHTCFKVVQQLLAEKRDKSRVVRRRNIQALMSFDVCMQQLERQQPIFSTIFANHVAAAMHRYWAAGFPDDYEQNHMPNAWRHLYKDEIDAAMQEADYMLGRLLKFAQKRPEYSIMVLSSMGQAAIEHEVVKDQLVIKDMQKFMQSLGFSPDDYDQLPGMEPEYIVQFKSADLSQRFNRVSKLMSINGEKPDVKPANEVQTTFLIFQYNVNFTRVDLQDEATGVHRSLSLAEAGLFAEPIQDMTGSTAQHIPQGCCFVFNAKQDLSALGGREETVDLCGVTASIIEALQVPVPPYMPQPIPVLVAALSNQSSWNKQLIKDRRRNSTFSTLSGYPQASD